MCMLQDSLVSQDDYQGIVKPFLKASGFVVSDAWPSEVIQQVDWSGENYANFPISISGESSLIDRPLLVEGNEINKALVRWSTGEAVGHHCVVQTFLTEEGGSVMECMIARLSTLYAIYTDPHVPLDAKRNIKEDTWFATIPFHLVQRYCNAGLVSYWRGTPKGVIAQYAMPDTKLIF